MISKAQAFIRDHLSRVLPDVAKPGRYAGGEINMIMKDAASCSLRVALAYPDVYEVGMSNLAIAILYDALNARDDTFAERVFAPWTDAEAALQAADTPLFSLETQTPLFAFDWIGFSLASELCYTNVLNILHLGGVPIRSSDRDERHPLVIAGGHCAACPEPMSPFIDAFVIGEAEEVIHEMIEAWQPLHVSSRADLLAALARIPGVYVPSLYRVEAGSPVPIPIRDEAPSQVRRRYISDLAELRFPTKPIVPLVEVVHDRISVEVMRGCTRGCRFCQAGMITRPQRERSAAHVMELSRELIHNTGHEDVSLVSLSTSDHSEVHAMVDGLIDEFGSDGIGVSLPSLRADRDCVSMAQQMQTVRKSGLTFAPEAGTQRLRDAINKGVTEENLMAAAEAAFGSGWRRIKLYFMIGLPTETDKDVIGIVDLGERVLALGRSIIGKAASVTVSVGAFVPKPHTPFQWRGQDPPDRIRAKQSLLKRAVRSRGLVVKVNEPEVAHIEGVLARGDRSVADAIEIAWRLGARLDAWQEHFHYARWQRAFELAGVDPYRTACRDRGYHEPLPWDHIETGVSKGYLRNEDRRAERGQLTADCHYKACTMCQACERWLDERRKPEGRRMKPRGGGE
ncbi:MAG: TIGR03960 family B12-binding radical SAM protein [Chthonomonadales bacterium]|nr:TIGR03960 family B12-binding radical SAM protein [Chthonomonadales bacterium]